jgi:hypothetical protein
MNGKKGKTKKVRAQAGIELTALMGIFMIIILVYAVAASGILFQLGVQGGYDDAYNSVRDLASAADSVYSQGEGASQAVQVKLPPNSILDSDKSFIGRAPRAPAAAATTINLNVNGTDVFAITRAPLVGHFPSAIGEHSMLVASHGTYVSISPYLIEASPPAIEVKMPPGSTRQVVVSAKAVQDARLSVNASAPWPHPDTELNVTPPHFLASSVADIPVILSFGAGADAGGLYYSQLELSCLSPGGGGIESVKIPITLEVTGG